MQAIITKYYGPTNTQGERIKAKCDAGSLTIDYPHELSGEAVHRKAAEALCDKLGWNGDYYGKLVCGQLPNGEYVFTFAQTHPQCVKTFIANLRHAVRNRETVTIGGGEFSPQELSEILFALGE